MLHNLVSNALKYGRTGTPICLRAARDGTKVRVSVVDQGEGIAPEHLPRLTERFYRVDTSRSRSMGGTGLGLAIVKHIVSNHGGEVVVWSEEGAGSTFTLRLPAAAPARHTPDAEPPAGGHTVAHSARKAAL